MALVLQAWFGVIGKRLIWEHIVLLFIWSHVIKIFYFWFNFWCCHFHPYKKILDKWEINSLSTIQKIGVVGQAFTPISGEIGPPRDLPMTSAYLKQELMEPWTGENTPESFWWIVEAKCGLAWEWDTPGNAILREVHIFLGFISRDLATSSWLRSEKGSLLKIAWNIPGGFSIIRPTF